MVSHGTPDHVHVALEFETKTMTQMSSLDDKLRIFQALRLTLTMPNNVVHKPGTWEMLFILIGL